MDARALLNGNRSMDFGPAGIVMDKVPVTGPLFGGWIPPANSRGSSQ